MSAEPGFGDTLPPSRARRWVLAFGAALTAAVALSAALTVRPLMSGRSELTQVRQDDLARHQVADLRTTLAEWQLFVEQHAGLLSASAAKIDAIELAKGALLITDEQSQMQALGGTLRGIGLSSLARDLESGSAAFQTAVEKLSPLVAGAPSAVITELLTSIRSAFARMWALTATASDRLNETASADLREGNDHLDSGAVTVLALDGMFALLAIAGAVVLGQRAHRRELRQRETAQRQSFESVLQQALDMSTFEPDVYTVLNEALTRAAPSLQAEMLIADSSRAHFHRVFGTATGPDARTGCGVMSPQDCPATIRAHTLVFPTSRALDACPYLKHRSTGECSAVCVPVSIAGKTVGVTHATGPDREPVADGDVRYLEIASRRASERLAMVRAFEKSEMQAQRDPLTGLLNRRSLENRVRDLQHDGVPYMLAYGDLDHFKVLNDTHGHEAGDQALRLFARIMRDSVRPNDQVARYGGEEFVIVLPDCTTEAAVAVLERVRERLALALTSGRVPAFTVSFGVASSSQQDTFDDILATADRALLDAKAAGRNRVSLAYPADPDAEPGAIDGSAEPDELAPDGASSSPTRGVLAD